MNEQQYAQAIGIMQRYCPDMVTLDGQFFAEPRMENGGNTLTLRYNTQNVPVNINGRLGVGLRLGERKDIEGYLKAVSIDFKKDDIDLVVVQNGHPTPIIVSKVHSLQKLEQLVVPEGRASVMAEA